MDHIDRAARLSALAAVFRIVPVVEPGLEAGRQIACHIVGNLNVVPDDLLHADAHRPRSAIERPVEAEAVVRDEIDGNRLGIVCPLGDEVDAVMAAEELRVAGVDGLDLGRAALEAAGLLGDEPRKFLEIGATRQFDDFVSIHGAGP